ncbi:hypothetical protein F5Y18DRAFT_169270 [Xylariaceae sp. FL1019]|nr:hypothetical protein F5Y18DRAFT_169270 [Xylariaceae sp. FL1019]
MRIGSMDANNVSLQVLSHVPGTLSPDTCAKANDEMAKAIKANPSRLAAFANLPVGSPESCPAELRRCVQQLGFIGALIDNRAGGTYYDGEAYMPLWETAQELDVPLYLHPTFPSKEQTQASYSGNFSDDKALAISAFGWGWHSDVAVHILRLYAAGVFEKYPRVKIIIGHYGEMIPYMLDRVNKVMGHFNMPRSFRQVWDENIWITTSGVWSVDPMAVIVRNTKIDHILYSVDYPFAKNEDGLKFLDELEQSGLVTREQLDCIAYKNAEKLLKVKIHKKFE